MKTWVTTPNGSVFSLNAIEVIFPENGGSRVHFTCGQSIWLPQSPTVLLSEIKESGDGVMRLP